jgi:glutaryl-CoA dehydrogenase
MVAIRRFGSLDLQQQWLPGLAAGQSVGAFALTEPAIGSDPAHLTTTARQDGSDWVLSGEKKWITNGGVADVVIVWAQTTNGIRGFAVPADSPGMHMTPIRHKRSLRASVTSQLELREVRVPQSACLEGARGIRAALSCLNEARFGIIFGALGAAADCLATATAYARNREQFGRPIAGFQLTQQKLVDMGIALGNGLLLALHLAQAKDRGDCSAQQISVGKLHSTRAAVDIARQSRSILGANGTTADFSVMRHMANLESVLTYEGTAEMHTLVVGQAMTGLPAFR